MQRELHKIPRLSSPQRSFSEHLTPRKYISCGNSRTAIRKYMNNSHLVGYCIWSQLSARLLWCSYICSPLLLLPLFPVPSNRRPTPPELIEVFFSSPAVLVWRSAPNEWLQAAWCVPILANQGLAEELSEGSSVLQACQCVAQTSAAELK